MTHFPDTPHDGEQVVESRGDGAVRIWTYNQAKNEWTYEDYTSAPAGTVMYTDQVLVRENAANEEVHSALADPSELKTQKEVNYYLDEKFGQGPDINLDDYATEAWVEQRFAPKADLYKVEAKVGMGVWKFSREAGAARNGEFRMVTREGAPTETWTAVARFGVNERDRRNMLFDWSRLATGDEVLITNKNNPGNYARFEIDPAQDGVMEVLRLMPRWVVPLITTITTSRWCREITRTTQPRHQWRPLLLQWSTRSRAWSPGHQVQGQVGTPWRAIA